LRWPPSAQRVRALFRKGGGLCAAGGFGGAVHRGGFLRDPRIHMNHSSHSRTGASPGTGGGDSSAVAMPPTTKRRV
jgi:hypothetical protein